MDAFCGFLIDVGANKGVLVTTSGCLTVYDAAYLDLAVREGSQLASLDDALQKAAVKAAVVLFELPRSV
jgi:hypothetical protein